MSGRDGWHRGALHAHSLWSDGNDFAESVGLWYRRHGYSFCALTDHNTVATEPRWMPEDGARARGLGEDLVRRRDDERALPPLARRRAPDGSREVRLMPLDEVRGAVAAPGEFLLLPGQEVSSAAGESPVHCGVLGVPATVPPCRCDSVGGVVREVLARANRLAQATGGAPFIIQLNHPNYGWACSTEDLLALDALTHLEIYNGHPEVRQPGDAQHPSTEALWDLVNFARARRGAPLLLGVATDDSHTYGTHGSVWPGRGWVEVRTGELTERAVLGALAQGDFYASTGVELCALELDAVRGEVRVEAIALPNERLHFEVLGARASHAAPSILHAEHGRALTYHAAGDELFVRVRVTAPRPTDVPNVDRAPQRAWTQPFVPPATLRRASGAGR